MISRRQQRRDFGNRKPRGFGSQSTASRDSRVHFDHDDLAIFWVDRKLNVAAARVHTNLADDGEAGIAQFLVVLV